jgi:hypothetical protein
MSTPNNSYWVYAVTNVVSVRMRCRYSTRVVKVIRNSKYELQKNKLFRVSRLSKDLKNAGCYIFVFILLPISLLHSLNEHWGQCSS